MNCEEAIGYIHSLEKFGIQPGLDKIGALCDALGNPQRDLKVIHVAGTNGKGSTSTMISNILIKAGYDVGLYISPYVSDFRERIGHNGDMIEKEMLAECVSKVKNAIEQQLKPKGIQPTEFEALTAAAFVYYQKCGCDFVVLEVGLGGRFDATNIIGAPLVSVIASISLDHTAILGDTISKIAFEKCGIIKENSVTVSYPLQTQEALTVIKSKCEEMHNPLVIPDTEKTEIVDEKYNGTAVKYGETEYFLPLAGKHMVYNSITAIEAVRSLKKYGFDIEEKAIIEGIKSSVMPARLELTGTNPITVLDGGHNEGCGAAVEGYIKKYFRNRKIIMVSSIMADKDYDAYLRRACSFADIFIATRANVPRALSAEELKTAAEKYCEKCLCIPDPVKATEYARSICESEDILFVCGSFYLAGEIRNILLSHS